VRCFCVHGAQKELRERPRRAPLPMDGGARGVWLQARGNTTVCLSPSNSASGPERALRHSGPKGRRNPPFPS